jgi:hypothetical protein
MMTIFERREDLIARCVQARAFGLDTIAIAVTDDNRAEYHDVIGGVQGVVSRVMRGITVVDVRVADIWRALAKEQTS